MTYDIRQKYFESRHIQEFLGIDKNQLFHWVQTKRLIEPAKVGKGRGGRSQFSFANLLDLALIKELSEFGVELNALKMIIEGKAIVIVQDKDNPKKGVITKGRSTCEIFKEKREKYEKVNLYLSIYLKDKSYHYHYWSGQEGGSLIEESVIPENNWLPKTTLTINIVNLILDLEEKTGVKI